MQSNGEEVDSLKAFDKFCAVLDKIASAAMVALMVCLTVLIAFGSLMRYLFQDVTMAAWQNDITMICLSWIVFIGMSVAFTRDGHARLEFVSDALPEVTRVYWLACLDLVTLAVLICAGYFSIGVIQEAVPTLCQTIPVSRGLFYLPLPIGCGISVCHVINNNYKRIAGANKPAVSAE